MDAQIREWPQVKMEKRIVRYNQLIPCLDAFIDSKTPGSNKKENFCLIGPGVAERAGQHVHISIPHGFNIGGARQPNGYKNSQHSHETAEVFLVHKGQWAFRWGHDAKDGEAILGPGDVISIPLHVFRGFENVGSDDGFLFAVLGGDDPGNVTWAPYVFEDATNYGLVLLDDGQLIDTGKGETIPQGSRPVKATSLEDLENFRKMSVEEMLECVHFDQDAEPVATTAHARLGVGVTETPIIGSANDQEGITAGKMNWEHGFHFRRLDFNVDGTISRHAHAQEEVIFIQSGQLEYSWDGGNLTLNKGDTLTVPIGLGHAFRNISGGKTIAFAVHGGNQPRAPTAL